MVRKLKKCGKALKQITPETEIQREISLPNTVLQRPANKKRFQTPRTQGKTPSRSGFWMRVPESRLAETRCVERRLSLKCLPSNRATATEKKIKFMFDIERTKF
jgi:hypothetical protein